MACLQVGNNPVDGSALIERVAKTKTVVAKVEWLHCLTNTKPCFNATLVAYFQSE